MILDVLERHTETLLHHINMCHGMSNMDFQLRPETTLNYKYKVDETIPDTILSKINHQMPVNFFGIGKGGFYLDGGIKQPYKPKDNEMDLYEPIPFRCIGPGQSLSQYEREVYRFPVQKNINGVNYTCYYLKVLRSFKNAVDMVTVDNAGNETTYELSPDLLYPTPDPNYQLIPTQGNSNHRAAVIEFNHLTITPEELEDITNLFFEGDSSKVNISEFGLYSGYNDITENKAFYTQLAFKFCNTGVDFSTMNSTVGYSKNVKITFGNKLLI